MIRGGTGNPAVRPCDAPEHGGHARGLARAARRERAAESRIPEHRHIRVALPERPEQLDGYGGHRFVWALDAEAAAARRLAGSEVDGSSGTDAGTLTIFPMAEPQGALDVQLLEQWLREILAACGEPACVARDDAGACAARDEQERPATTQVHAPPGGR